MSKPCIVLGCGSQASAVISIIENSVDNYEIIGLVDTAEQFDRNEKKSDYSVIANMSDLVSFPDKYLHLYCVLAIGDNHERKEIYNKLISLNFKLPNIISNYSFVDRTVVMGEGNIIAHAVIINAQTIIGSNNLINTGSLVEHDCRVKDHTHIGPRAVLCGGVKISGSVFIGAGATLIPNISIEETSTVAAGAVVIKHVTDKGSVTIGVPAKEKK